MDFKAFILPLFILLLQEIPVHCVKPPWAGGNPSHGNVHGNPHRNPPGNPHVNPQIENVASCPEILSKRSWGGRDPIKVFYTILPIEYVIVHHTVSNPCNMERKCIPLVKNIQDYHMNELKLDDIGYNFLIGGDGSIYEGVGWHRRGSHTYGYNSRSIGIAFIGNYENYGPTKRAVEAAKDLIQCGINNNELAKDVKVYGGRQVQATLSPGEHLYDDMKTWPYFAEI